MSSISVKTNRGGVNVSSPGGHLINCLGLPLTHLVYRSWMSANLAPVMYWAVHTTLCSALQSDAEQLPYQAVMHLVRMLLNFLFYLYLTRQVSYEQILIFKDGLGTVG